MIELNGAKRKGQQFGNTKRNNGFFVIFSNQTEATKADLFIFLASLNLYELFRARKKH